MLRRMSSTVYAGARHRSSSVVIDGRVEAGLGPPSGEERHLRRGQRARAQALELRALDLLGRGEPRGLEVLGRRRVRRAIAVVVDRLERPAEGAHASRHRQVALGEAVEVDRVVPQDLALAVVADQVGLEPEEVLGRPAGTSSRGAGSRSRTRCGRRPSSASRRRRTGRRTRSRSSSCAGSTRWPTS